MQSGEVLNVAALVPATRALGPGKRAALWLQGCSLPEKCPGCIAAHWIPIREATLMPIADVAAALCADESVEGLTLSGGEPSLQAAGLVRLIAAIRATRDWSVIAFSGFRYEELLAHPAGSAVRAYLDALNVLVDGPYRAELNDGSTFAGSRNQRVLTLRDHPQLHTGDWPVRQIEVHVQAAEVLVVGVPPLALQREALHSTLRQAHAPGLSF